MPTDIREALDRPVLPTERNLFTANRLTVRHPGYDQNNTLLQFVATDGTAAHPGVELGLVHTACAIVADNRFDGWLSNSRDPQQPKVALGPSDILPTGVYYFHITPPIDSTDHIYPVVPNFPSWTFPHNQLPASWLAPSIASIPEPTPAKSRDLTCRITQYRESTQAAHIIPQREKDWFAANNMDEYRLSGTKQGIDAADGDNNLILLRMDLHNLWDRMLFTIVPKLGTRKQAYSWVAHVNGVSQELHQLYHNLSLQPLTGVQREYLFARFAWDLFPSLHGFLQRGVRRQLKVCGVVRDYDGKECFSFCEGQGPYRSISPRKTSGSPTKRQRIANDTLAYHSTQPSPVSGASYSRYASLSSRGRSSFGREDDGASDTSNDEEANMQSVNDPGNQWDCQTTKHRRESAWQLSHDQDELRGRKRYRFV